MTDEKNDPSKTQALPASELEWLRSHPGLDLEETNPNLLEAKSERIKILEQRVAELESQKADLEDESVSLQRSLEMTGLRLQTMEAAFHAHERLHRTIHHRQRVAVTICYSGGKLWLSRIARQISGVERKTLDEISGVDDWTHELGEHLDHHGEIVADRALPLWRAYNDGETVLGEVIHAYGRRLNVDAYPFRSGHYKMAYCLWWDIDEHEAGGE